MIMVSMEYPANYELSPHRSGEGCRDSPSPTANSQVGGDAFVSSSQLLASHGGLIILPVANSFGQTTMRSPLACHCTNSSLTKPGPSFTSCVSSNCTRPRTPT